MFPLPPLNIKPMERRASSPGPQTGRRRKIARELSLDQMEKQIPVTVCDRTSEERGNWLLATGYYFSRYP